MPANWGLKGSVDAGKQDNLKNQKKKKKRNEMTVILYMSGSDGSSEKWTFSE